MAESSENKKSATSNLADELDTMLDESESSMEQANELIDDEDAIDRLLMDNAFDQSEDEFEDEFAEIDDLISDSLDETKDQDVDDFLDEFADEALEDNAFRENLDEDEFVEDEFSGKDILESPEKDIEQDTLVDIDEFEDVEEYSQSSKAEGDVDKEELPTMSELDITGDEFNNEMDLPEEGETSELLDGVESTAGIADQNEFNVDLSQIKEQLATLSHTQDTFEQQLAVVASQESISAISEELQNLADENKKQQRRLAQLEQQKPTVAYAALTVSIIALLVGGSLGFLGFRADSKTASMNDYILTLEEQLDAWIAKGNDSNELQSITARLNQMDMEVANFSAKLEVMKRESESVSDQGEGENVADQMKKLSDQVMQTAEVVEALQLKVDKIETSKKSVAKKPKIVKESWVVNLVSFKQEWYAKRKASEYQKQGVPVEMKGVQIKGENWYRLRVGGFKSKYEAAAYAAKVKKSLNLTSVWVTKD